MSPKSKKALPDTRMPASMKVVMALAAVAFVAWAVFLWRGQPLYAHKLPAARTATEAHAVATLGGRIRFDDVKRQSREFIGYSQSIRLTSEQEAIKAEALRARPAACCRKSNALTCCCTCNLSKSVWGLTNYAIAKHHASVKEVHAVVDAWLAFVNPSGFDGETCYRGGCALPGAQKGCGGMSENDVTL